MRNKTDNNIRKYRTECGFTQEELAKRVGVTRLTIISLEKKKYEATVGLALKLAKVFNCTVEELFMVEEEN